MDDLYRENLMDHYRHPRNRGALDALDGEHEALDVDEHGRSSTCSCTSLRSRTAAAP